MQSVKNRKYASALAYAADIIDAIAGGAGQRQVIHGDRSKRAARAHNIDDGVTADHVLIHAVGVVVGHGDDLFERQPLRHDAAGDASLGALRYRKLDPAR